MVEYIILIAFLLLTSIAAVMVKNMLHSAIFLALASIFLSLIMFEMDAPWAGVFELSVCAGLITVLFASTVSMIQQNKRFFKTSKMIKMLPIAIVLFIIALIFFGKPLLSVLTAHPETGQTHSVGDIIWGLRFRDVIAQLSILVAGVLTIKAFFWDKKLGEENDRNTK